MAKAQKLGRDHLVKAPRCATADAECTAVHLQAHEPPQDWSAAEMQIGSSADIRWRPSSSADRLARCSTKCDRIIFNSWTKSTIHRTPSESSLSENFALHGVHPSFWTDSPPLQPATLNYDLALSAALSGLGAGKTVGVVERPEDLAHQKTINLYYLHRNANAADPELWVLRTAALGVEWTGHWEQIIASKVLVAPVVVFAGLGTPVAVLIESTKLLRAALPAITKLYLADPGDMASSKFFQALGLDAAHFIPSGWGSLMEELSKRLLDEQIVKLQQAAFGKTTEDHLPNEDITPLLTAFHNMGIVRVGKLRALATLRKAIPCFRGKYSRPACGSPSGACNHGSRLGG